MDQIDPNNQQPQPPKSSSASWVVGLIIIALVVAGVLWARSSQNTDDSGNEMESEETMTPTPTPTPPSSVTPTPPGEVSGNQVKTFNVDGDNFSFSLKEIKVKKGDTVKIVFNNKIGFHDWVVDEFNARTKQIQAGQSETIEFVADKTGTFEYYCSVGQHRANGMKGNLIVE